MIYNNKYNLAINKNIILIFRCKIKNKKSQLRVDSDLKVLKAPTMRILGQNIFKNY